MISLHDHSDLDEKKKTVYSDTVISTCGNGKPVSRRSKEKRIKCWSLLSSTPRLPPCLPRPSLIAVTFRTRPCNVFDAFGNLPLVVTSTLEKCLNHALRGPIMGELLEVRECLFCLTYELVRKSIVVGFLTMLQI